MKRSSAACSLALMALIHGSCGEPEVVHPHMDHSPRHGGLVMMLGDLHYEVVLDPGGRHRMYFTDATRAELPPYIASEVTIVITRREGDAEPLVARIDAEDGAWIAEGRQVDDIGAVGRIDFTLKGQEPYWIDLPFGFTSPS